MSDQKKRKTWSDIKTRLETLDRKGLVSLIGDLYDASVANRRFLQTRLAPDARAIEDYRRLVVAAIYPDPFSNRRVSVRDAAAAIIEYKRSTGDAAGTVDLMLTFVEAGTEQAADLGYGDESYFNALETRLDAVAKEFDALPADVREKVRARLGRIQKRAQAIGWGFGDAVDHVVHELTLARPARRLATPADAEPAFRSQDGGSPQPDGRRNSVCPGPSMIAPSSRDCPRVPVPSLECEQRSNARRSACG